jgi:hypothetical protein
MAIWSARMALAYGSRLMGEFNSEAEARLFAENHIAKEGGIGKITCVINDTVYYDIHDPEA